LNIERKKEKHGNRRDVDLKFKEARRDIKFGGWGHEAKRPRKYEVWGIKKSHPKSKSKEKQPPDIIPREGGSKH